MKKFAFLLAALCLVAACNDSDDGPDVVNLTSPETQIISADGGSATFTFTTNGDWTANVPSTAAYSWSSILPTKGGAGENTITVTVLPNKTNDDRNMHFTIKSGSASKEVAVMQTQKDGLGVITTDFTLPAEGGTFTVGIMTNVSYSYTIADSWISWVSTKALSSKEETFSVDPNPTFEDRTSTITFTGAGTSQVVTVTQKALSPYFGVLLDGVDVTWGTLTPSREGETIVLDTYGNLDFEVDRDFDWGTVEKSGDQIVVKIEENATFAEREGYIYVSTAFDDWGAMICVVQPGVTRMNLETTLEWKESLSATGAVNVWGPTRRLAYSSGKLLLSDGESIHIIDPASGSVERTVTLPDGMAPSSLASDSAGHILIAADADFLDDFVVYELDDLASDPVEFIRYPNNSVWDCPMGNLRVFGDIKGKSTIVAVTPIYKYFAAWETNSGAPEYKTLAALPDDTGWVWSLSGLCAAPLGSSLSDGLVYIGYDDYYDLRYAPDGTTWDSAGSPFFATSSDGNENYNALAAADFMGLKFCAILRSAHFSWGMCPEVYLLDVSTPEEGPIQTAYVYNDDLIATDFLGTGAVSDVILVPEEDALYMYVVDGNYDSLAKVKFTPAD